MIIYTNFRTIISLKCLNHYIKQKNCLKIRYIFSACVVVETPDITIVSDPWFTSGEYGSWVHYPPLPDDPVDIIGKVDLIYVSHLHSDHYDPLFLRKYFKKFPDAKLIISDTGHKMLERRMIQDGFDPIVCKNQTFGETKLYFTVNGGYDYEMDTAILIVHGKYSIANMNDNRIDQEQIDYIKKQCPDGRPTVALLTYAGAGPYPQTYYFENDDDRKKAEKSKREQFLKVYSDFCKLLDPIRAMPFAGSYVLGGPLSKYNSIRGVADATEVLSLNDCGKISFVLDDGGDAEFDLTALTANKLRTNPYSYKDIDEYLRSIPFHGYTYETEFQPIGDKPLPLKRLCETIYQKAILKHSTEESWWICFKPKNTSNFLAFNTKENSGVIEKENVDDLKPRWEIHLDDRLLFLVLSGYYHWANAEGGSHLYSKRIPNRYVEEIQTFLYFFII